MDNLRLITLRCPACGADLNVAEGRSVYYCSYCQQKILLDDEAEHVKVSFENARESGYEFERGRISAQSDGADREVIEEVGKLAETLPKLERLHANYEASKKKMQDLKTSIDKSEGFFVKHTNIFVALACFIIAIYSAASGVETEIVLIYMAAAVGAFFLIKLKQENDISRYKQQYEHALSDSEKYQKEIRNLEGFCNLGIVPSQYLNSDAVGFIHSALMNKRAISISQAINLFEEQCHKDRMEKMQREQLESQRRIEEQNKNNRNNYGAGSLGQSVMTGVGIGIGSAIVKGAFKQLKKW